MPRHEPQKMTHLPGTQPSKVEDMAGKLLEEVATVLLARIKGGEAKAADLRVALELIKYTGTQDVRAISPVRDLEKEHPFDSIDQEIA